MFFAIILVRIGETGFFRAKHTILIFPIQKDLRGLPRGGNLLLNAPAAIGAAGAPPLKKDDSMSALF